MILHTIINEYDVLMAENSIAEPEYISKDGMIIEYRNIDGKRQITRLLSTDPSDYLKEKYQPQY